MPGGEAVAHQAAWSLAAWPLLTAGASVAPTEAAYLPGHASEGPSTRSSGVPAFPVFSDMFEPSRHRH